MSTSVQGEQNSPAANKLPPVLLSALNEKHVYTESNERIPLGSNVSLAEATELYEMVRRVKPATSAEIGFAQGISTMAILQALHDNNLGMHHVIDPYQSKSFKRAGLGMVKRAGLDGRMTFHESFPVDASRDLPALQFAFIDASHLFDLTIVDFIVIDTKLQVGGVVGFHDLWMESLQKVIRYILENRGYRLINNNPASQARATLGLRIKHAIQKGLGSLPGAERLFRPEVIKPWSDYGLGNMAFLEKTEEDRREWTLHREF